VVTLRDVTDRHRSLRSLADSEQLYRLLAENAWDCIWTMEVDGSISYISPSVERMRGFTPAEAAVQTLDQIHTADSAAQVSQYFADLHAAMAAGVVPPIYHGEREYYRKDGSIMLGELQVIPQVDDEGQVVRILGVTRDISDRRRYEEQLSALAITDPLTGVWNRRHGEQLFNADLSEARRYGPALTMLMLDVDRFKAVNDNYGHQVGDFVLVEVTRRLTANLRPSDVLARWGGDEFLIVMRHCTIAEGVQLAEKLRSLVADTAFDTVGQVTVSIGAAELHSDDDLASWLGRADAAVYEAKSMGRNSVHAVANA
jgi:diguanylate cyclase (GGDEF)-like protein/PAS domain S-box-containing protein